MSIPDVSKTRGFVEKTIVILLFLALLYASYLTMSSFLGIFTFAIIFSVPFSGLFEKMTAQVGGRRKLVAFLYGLILVTFIAVPLIYIISALADYAHQVQTLVAQIKDHQVPPLPEWIRKIPIVGNKTSRFWAGLEQDPEGTLKLYEPEIKAVLQHVLSAGGGIVSTGLELIVGIIISAIFLFNGESAIKPVKTFFSRILDEETSDAMLKATGRAINGVAIGVMGTAMIEALVAWIGFKIAGMDMAGGLAGITFLLALVQLGPIPVQLPVIIWFFNQGNTTWGIFMIVWLVVLFVIDNVLKPILIGKSGKLPILVLFLGVVGGMGAWGFTGMFKGAIVLAIMYTIFNNWAAKAQVKE